MTQQRHALTDAQWQRMVAHLPRVLQQFHPELP